MFPFIEHMSAYTNYCNINLYTNYITLKTRVYLHKYKIGFSHFFFSFWMGLSSCHHHNRVTARTLRKRASCVSVSEPAWHFMASGSTYQEGGERERNNHNNYKINITHHKRQWGPSHLEHEDGHANINSTSFLYPHRSSIEGKKHV